MIIRAFYGLTQDPFDNREIQLLPQQQEIHDTLKVHCQQGGLCLVLGVPGTGKTVIKQSLQLLPENQYLSRPRRADVAHLHEHRQDSLRVLPHRV